jgi:hypothetical protein
MWGKIAGIVLRRRMRRMLRRVGGVRRLEMWNGDYLMRDDIVG